LVLVFEILDQFWRRKAGGFGELAGDDAVMGGMRGRWGRGELLCVCIRCEIRYEVVSPLTLSSPSNVMNYLPTRAASIPNAGGHAGLAGDLF